jgi:Flp pilus assembly pilin Flp
MKKIALEQNGFMDKGRQDYIEYALMVGFVAVATIAIVPDVATSVSTFFSQISHDWPGVSRSLTFLSSANSSV